MMNAKSQATTDLVTPEAVMGFMLWPENPFWSFQFIRLVAESYSGGADFTECYLALCHIRVGNVEEWFKSLSALAYNLEKKAEIELENGHSISARQKWLRSCNYYRAVGSFYTVFDSRGIDLLNGRRRCFQNAARISSPPITPVEIPYENTSLPGYFCSAKNTETQAGPSIILFGGGDAVSEEMYFRLGGPLVERGFNVLLIDGPGQGEALRRGIVNRYDWEVPVGASFNFLMKQSNNDSKRIAVVGSSMGGFYAARAAAFEHRLAACVVWGGAYDLSYALTLPHSRDPEALSRGLLVFGAKDLDEGKKKIAQYTLNGITGQISCPVLVVTGEAEMAFMHPAGTRFRPSDWYLSHPIRLFEEILHDQKKLLFYPIGGPGALHDQADSDATAIEDICDWLETILKAQH